MILKEHRGRIFRHWLQLYVAFNHSVNKIYPPAGTVCKLFIMSDNNNGLMQFFVKAVKKLINIVC